ncbi:MAG: HAD family hydrolase [Candidatus Hydrogenedentota bacterium]
MQALIFDFDGLILDTESCDLQAWQETFAANGGELDFEEWAEWLGVAAADCDLHSVLERQIGRSLDREVVRAAFRQRYYALVREKPLGEGVLDYLHDAERLGLRIGLASSATRDWAEGHLRRFDLFKRFHATRCAGEAPQTKPAPDLYEAVLRDLGAPPNSAIALEDSPNGVRAAKAAGLFTVAVPNAVATGLNFDGVDLRLNRLTDLPLEALLDKARKARQQI